MLNTAAVASAILRRQPTAADFTQAKPNHGDTSTAVTQSGAAQRCPVPLGACARVGPRGQFHANPAKTAKQEIRGPFPRLYLVPAGQFRQLERRPRSRGRPLPPAPLPTVVRTQTNSAKPANPQPTFGENTQHSCCQKPTTPPLGGRVVQAGNPRVIVPLDRRRLPRPKPAPASHLTPKRPSRRNESVALPPTRKPPAGGMDVSPRGTSRLRWCAAIAAALAVLLATGCATWEPPRIDPTGEHFLIFPNAAPDCPTVSATADRRLPRSLLRSSPAPPSRRQSSPPPRPQSEPSKHRPSIQTPASCHPRRHRAVPVAAVAPPGVVPTSVVGAAARRRARAARSSRRFARARDGPHRHRSRPPRRHPFRPRLPAHRRTHRMDARQRRSRPIRRSQQPRRARPLQLPLGHSPQDRQLVRHRLDRQFLHHASSQPRNPSRRHPHPTRRSLDQRHLAHRRRQLHHGLRAPTSPIGSSAAPSPRSTGSTRNGRSPPRPSKKPAALTC